ncbi:MULTISPECIES: carbonic anhydrase [Brevibacterium]|jgi:carbonic anhydrase|uniref:carbonic anhydrase n=1 Tax=Brevibacterium salitolerans TaxID=1403566 RepID=A0ABN2W8E6_9MICO|nr:carbonic anhydrase [Brevibacterium sp.]
MPNSAADAVSPARRFTTPGEAYAALMEGNARYVDGNPAHPNQDVSRRSALANVQEPFVTLFGCSDSRVAAEMIFDVGLGDMFVVRTAGQVSDSASIGTLEYGVEVLGTPLLVVLGHDSCGAVTAAVESYTTGETPGGFIEDLVTRILPSVVHARSEGFSDLQGAVVQNTIDTVMRLPRRSTLIRRALRRGSLEIVGLTYHLADGRVNLVSRLGAAVNDNGNPVDLVRDR